MSPLRVLVTRLTIFVRAHLAILALALLLAGALSHALPPDSAHARLPDPVHPSPLGSVHAQAPVTVTTTADSGPGSLRQAILDANALPGANVITFNIPGAGPHTIQPTSALPIITDAATIDGCSQPGADCSQWPPTLLIELDGTNAGTRVNGLQIEASNSVVRGLVVNRFDDTGIMITWVLTENVWIHTNFVGTNVAGTSKLSCGQRGIASDNDAKYTTIGTNGDGVNDEAERNLVVGDSGTLGISVHDSVSSQVMGNFVNTNKNGTTVLGGADGITLHSSLSSRIGTNGDGISDEIEGNVILKTSASQSPALDVWVSEDSVVAGNYIRGDASAGIAVLYSVRTIIGTDSDGVADSEEGNTIINCRYGIILTDDNPDGVIAGNVITGGSLDGVYIGPNSDNNIIGGSAPHAANTITGSGGYGIIIKESDGNQIIGNVIWDAGLDGIYVESGTNNRILGNSIHSNGELGIELRGYYGTATPASGWDSVMPDTGDTVTFNDSSDVDSGANGLQNFPVINYVTSTFVSGTLSSTPSTTFTLEFFSNTVCDPSNFGEGETVQPTIAPAQVTTDPTGSAAFTFWFAHYLTAGHVLTATATGPDGTSEFSRCVTIQVATNQPPVNTVPGPQQTYARYALIFSSETGNAIQVSDLDAGLNPLRVRLTVMYGTLTLSGTAGLSFTVGDGADDVSMTFTGPLSAINAALDGLRFVPEDDYTGAALLTIVTDDQGYTGTGGPLDDTDQVAITIEPWPVPPGGCYPFGEDGQVICTNN